MTALIATSFSPNYQPDDVRLALSLVFKRRKHFKNIFNTLTDKLSRLYHTRSISYFSSGRGALYYALKSLGLKNDDEIIIQAFTCIAVPNALVWAGLKPVFADICDDYNIDPADVEKKITPKTKAVIVQHTFGLPADMRRISKIAKKHNLIVIEDCAHSLGCVLDGNYLGTFGDLAILSFGRDKTFSSVFGGAIVCNNKKFLEAIRSQSSKLTPAPNTFVLKQLYYLIVYSISLRLYRVGIGKVLLRSSRFLGLLLPAVFPIEKSGGMPPFIPYSFDGRLASLLAHQLIKMDTYINHRVELTKKYNSLLGLKLPPQPYLRIPLWVQDKPRALKMAAARGIHLGNWYRGSVDPPDSVVDFYKGDCPRADALARHTINLPTNINTTLADVEKVADFIKNNTTRHARH